MAAKRNRRWHDMCIRGAMVLDRESGEHVPVRRQVDALAFFREILHRHGPQEAVTGASDSAWLSWLVAGSPEAVAFHGPPPYAFLVHANAELGYAGKGQGFSLTRFDPARGLLGTTMDTFSIPRVLADKAKEEEDNIVRAFRNAVEDQLILFRNKKIAAGIVCPYKKVVLHAGDAYVVHAPAFKDWVQTFLSLTGVARTQLRMEGSLLWELAEPAGWARLNHGFIASWREFHEQAALPSAKVVSFQGFFAALREAKEHERAVQDISLMAMRTGR